MTRKSPTSSAGFHVPRTRTPNWAYYIRPIVRSFRVVLSGCVREQPKVPKARGNSRLAIAGELGANNLFTSRELLREPTTASHGGDWTSSVSLHPELVAN